MEIVTAAEGDPRPLLVYDGSNRLFRTVATRLTDDSRIRPVPWDTPAVRAFLDAQFGGQPFAFLFVDGDEVYAGEAAVGRLLRRGGLTQTARFAERLYPAVAGPFGRIVHGQTPSDVGGVFTLDEEAAGHLAPLRAAQPIPVTER